MEMFKAFNLYDDEGYMMLTVKHFLDYRPLFDETVTLYGPFYYLFQFVIHRELGVPITHDWGRVIALGFWMIIAGLCALNTYQITRRQSLAALVSVLAVFHLDAIRFGPGHPQELCGLFIVLAVVLAVLAERGRLMVLMVGSGIMAASLLLTKINVGVFLTAALVLAFLSSAGRGPLISLAWWLMAVAVILLPFALIRAQLGASWAISFALLVSLSIVPMLAVGRGLASPTLSRRHLVMFFGVCTVTSLAILSFVLARGTTIHGLVAGLWVAPQRLIGGFGGSVPARPLGAAWAVFSTVLAGIHFQSLRRAAPGVELRHQRIMALTKFAFAGCVFLAVLRGRTDLLLNFGTPLLWLALTAYPAAARPACSTLPRLVLCLTAALQTLQVYPVPGGQMKFGTFLMVPAAALCVSDAGAWFDRNRGEGRQKSLMYHLGFSAMALLLSPLAISRFVASLEEYRAAIPIHMPGARLVRTDELGSAIIGWLASNLRADADTFVCTTGFNSLYFWTEKPPPTSIVLGNSIAILSEEQQKNIAAALSEWPQACAIIHPGFFKTPLSSASSPLRDYVDREFVTWIGFDGFEFRIRRDRLAPVPLDCAYFTPESSEVNATSSKSRASSTRSMILDLTARPGKGISRISIYSVNQKREVADSSPKNGQRTLEVWDRRSASLSLSEESLPTGIMLDSECSLTLIAAKPWESENRGIFLIRLWDQKGRLIVSLPLVELSFVPQLQPQPTSSPTTPLGKNQGRLGGDSLRVRMIAEEKHKSGISSSPNVDGPICAGG